MPLSYRFWLVAGCISPWVFGGLPAPSMAQITPDATLGTEASRVAPGVEMRGDIADLVEGGAVRGSNLFHSFLEFNIADGQRVYFDQPNGIINIFGRITGDSGSNIMGTLGVDGLANLVLINPNGILFGPNAQLDVAGSFTASTAESIVFDDGQTFNAVNPGAPPILRLNITPGLQYGDQSATLVNQGNLRTGQNLTLGAHTLNIGGQLEAGRDIILQGQERQLSEGEYTVDGYLFTQDLSGAGIDLIIPHENVIVARGDVRFDDPLFSVIDLYVVSSLHILAGGQIEQINKDASITSLENTRVNRVDQIISNGIGDFQSITVASSGRTTIDFRGGFDWNEILGGIPENSNSTNYFTSFENSNSDIDKDTVLGNIETQGGNIFLSSIGNIFTGNLNASAPSLNHNTQNSGSIYIEATQNIFTGNIVSTSGFLPEDEINRSNVGTISLFSGGDTLFRNLTSSSLSSSAFQNIFGGNGGDITILSRGSISGENITSRSDSSSFLGVNLAGDSIRLGDIQGGNGGNISIIAEGDISLRNLDSSSISSSISAVSGFSGDVVGGHGGNIYISGENITLGNLRSSTFSVSSSSDSLDRPSDSFAFIVSGDVFGGNAGDIYLSSNNKISTGIIASSSQTSSRTFSDLIFRNLPTGNVVGGNGGDVRVFSVGDINGSNIDSFSRSDSRAGNIRQGGSGGSIEIISSFGSINFSFDDLPSSPIFSSPFSGLGAYSLSQTDLSSSAGEAGELRLHAVNGQILFGTQTNKPAFLLSFSIAENGISGSGGSVEIVSGGSIRNVEILTTSSSARSGDVTISGMQDYRISNLSVLTTRELELEDPSDPSILIPVNVDGTGQPGNINIIGFRSLSLIDSSFISDTKGTDRAGNVVIFSPGWIDVDSTSLSSDTQGFGQAGSLQINAGQGIRLTGSGSQFLAQTNAEGSAGSIEINTPQVIIEQGAQVSTSTSSTGAAGNITINSDRLTLTEGGRILAATTGAGDSGTITINATEAVNLGEGVQDFAPIISVEASDAGRPGNIIINTPQFTLSETAQITATATATATNPAGGGSITINADQMDLAGIVGVFAETEGQAPGGVLTLQPYQGNPNLALTFAPGATISASTSGSGSGGDLRVSAPDTISISGPGRLAVETSGTGRGGNIDISAQRLTLNDGVALSASTSGAGQAGNIHFNVADTLTFDRGFVESSTSAESTGVGGNITVRSGQTTLRNGSQLVVTSLGQGQGGNIVLEGNRLTFDNSRMLAETSSSDGGNISLALDNLLLLRNGSLVSTTAGTAQSGGDGGNITITVPFIVAILTENSDIAADAFEGDGGNVNIAARGIFGIEPRPQRTPLSDITASSELGVSGTVAIDALDTSFIETSLTNLEDVITDTAALTAGSCIARADDSLGDFVVTGSGGLPQRPGDSGISAYPTGTVRTLTEPTATLQEPDGVYQLPNGRLVLSHACE